MRKAEIVQHLARPSTNDARFTTERRLHVRSTQPANQNTGMKNYLDQSTDLCTTVEFLLNIEFYHCGLTSEGAAYEIITLLMSINF